MGHRQRLSFELVVMAKKQRETKTENALAAMLSHLHKHVQTQRISLNRKLTLIIFVWRYKQTAECAVSFRRDAAHQASGVENQDVQLDISCWEMRSI